MVNGQESEKKLEKRETLRFQKFTRLYLESGNAYRSALAAGYARNTAKVKSCEMARLVRVKAAEALRALGIDETQVALKLKEKLGAKEFRWNPAKKKWETFIAHKPQLEATKELARILDMYPAQKIGGPTGSDPIPVRIIRSSIPNPPRGKPLESTVPHSTRPSRER